LLTKKLKFDFSTSRCEEQRGPIDLSSAMGGVYSGRSFLPFFDNWFPFVSEDWNGRIEEKTVNI